MAIELTLLVDLALIIIAGTSIGCIARALKQPIIVSYLLAGIVIGPAGLKLIANSADILLFAELGVAFLLFAVGIETDIAKMIRMKGTIIGGALLQVALTTGLVFLIMQFFALPFMESVYLGLILAFSSTVIVVKILTSRNEVSTLHGRLIIGFAVVQDSLAVLLLPLLAKPETIMQFSVAASFALSVFSLFALAYLLNRFVLPRVLAFFADTSELFFLIIVTVAFLFIYLSVLFDFSIAVGAFIGGISLSSLPYNVEASNKIRGLRDFFSTIFFVSIGMQIGPGIAGMPLPVLLIMLAVVYFLNPLIYFLIGLFAGYGGRIAFTIGMALGQASEFSFILASQALRLGQMSQSTYSAALVVIAISMMTTPYLVENSNFIYNRVEHLLNRFIAPAKRERLRKKLLRLEKLPHKKSMEQHVILVGAGVFGIGLVNLLKHYGTFVVVDHNPHVITDLIKKGRHAIYGTTDNEEVWDKVSLGNARLLIITIPNVKEASKLIKLARKRNPKIKIFARAHYYCDALALYREGADLVYMPHVVGSNAFIKDVGRFLETSRLSTVINLQEEYMSYLKEKAREEKEYFGIW